MTTGQRIKEARKKAGITQKELGNRLGISFQSVAQWENDLRNPKLETLQRIADALGIHMLDLVGVGEQLDKYRAAAILPNGERLQLTNNVRALYDQLSDSEKIAFMAILEAPEKPDKLREQMDTAYAKLNPTGQQEAVKRVEELTEIRKYQK